MPTTFPELPAWATTLAVSAITAVGGFILALVNRGPAMEEAINKRLATLMDGHRALSSAQAEHIDDLTAQVKSLWEEVIALRKALDSAMRDLHAAQTRAALAEKDCEACEKT